MRTKQGTTAGTLMRRLTRWGRVWMWVVLYVLLGTCEEGSIREEPAPPSFITLSNYSSTAMDIMWQPREGHTSEVYRSLQDDISGAELIATLDDEDEYDDRRLAPSTRYYYWVKLCKDSICTNLSEAVSAETPSGKLDVALIFLKESREDSPSFDKDQITDRVRSHISTMVKTMSYNVQSFDKVTAFGWYDVSPKKFKELMEYLGGGWGEIDAITQEVNAGNIDFHAHDLIILIYDDVNDLQKEALGYAQDSKRSVDVAGVDYGKKYVFHLFHKPSISFLEEQCFYKEEIYKELERCYDNPDGDNAKRIDSLFVHEFVHTKRAYHSEIINCSDALFLDCNKSANNYYDLMGPGSFRFGTSLNALWRYSVGWLTDERILQISEQGVYEVVLNTINAQSGITGVKIDIEGYEETIWLEFRTPGPYDYALSEEPFSRVRSGVMMYTGLELVDADIERTELRNVVITDELRIGPLGLEIKVTKVDVENSRIHVKITQGDVIPTRSPPHFIFCSL